MEKLISILVPDFNVESSIGTTVPTTHLNFSDEKRYAGWREQNGPTPWMPNNPSKVSFAIIVIQFLLLPDDRRHR